MRVVVAALRVRTEACPAHWQANRFFFSILEHVANEESLDNVISRRKRYVVNVMRRCSVLKKNQEVTYHMGLQLFIY